MKVRIIITETPITWSEFTETEFYSDTPDWTETPAWNSEMTKTAPTEMTETIGWDSSVETPETKTNGTLSPCDRLCPEDWEPMCVSAISMKSQENVRNFTAPNRCKLLQFEECETGFILTGISQGVCVSESTTNMPFDSKFTNGTSDELNCESGCPEDWEPLCAEVSLLGDVVKNFTIPNRCTLLHAC